mgnify:CR=1 FL=1
MTLREKLMHYTNDLGNVDLKQEAIATIEHIAQYMDEDELLHHSRPLALAYLALTEDASVPVVHGRWIEKSAPARKIYFECSHCGAQENKHTAIKGYYCWRCGAKMDGGADHAAD